MKQPITTSKAYKIATSIMYVVLIIISVLLVTDSFTKGSLDSKSLIFMVPVFFGLFRLFTMWRNPVKKN
ncbi:MAG: hypothetical protein ABI237_16605 [Ginsengibacter sp.]